MPILKPIAFRFDNVDHAYFIGAKQVPNTSLMLQRAGHVDPTYYTDAVRERGRAVHQLTAEYDLGALDVSTLVSKYRGWVLAHVAAMQRLRPTWDTIEEPEVHPVYQFGTRPDRVGKIYRVRSIVDEKSGGKEKWHGLQTALQAIGVAWRYNLKPESMPRFALYIEASGRFELEPHTRKTDFDEAYRMIKAQAMGKAA